MAGPQRNLLILLGHGLRDDALGGPWPLATPHLERLWRRGLRLSATSACPADPGGMVSLLTGLHTRQHGCGEQQGPGGTIAGFAGLLRDAGYHVAGVGRVAPIAGQLAEKVVVADVDALSPDGCAYLTAMHDMPWFGKLIEQRKARRRSGLFEPVRFDLNPDNDIDGYITREACDLLERMPADRPWALVVIFAGPGCDLAPPKLYDGLVDPASVASSFVPADLSQVNALAELDYPRVMIQRLTRKAIGRIRADYLGRVSMIDYAAGQLAARIEKRDDGPRVWTVLASDRGALLGEHGLVGHRSFLKAAVDVPVIVAPPTPVAKQPVGEPVSVVDVTATIAVLGGCDLSSAMTGRSLLPLLRGEPVQPAAAGEGVICEFGRRLMLQTARYKVVFDTETRVAAGLYDRHADPQEQKNLMETAPGSDLMDAMRWRVGDALLSLRASG